MELEKEVKRYGESALEKLNPAGNGVGDPKALRPWYALEVWRTSGRAEWIRVITAIKELLDQKLPDDGKSIH